jgi:hypothetical protein
MLKIMRGDDVVESSELVVVSDELCDGVCWSDKIDFFYIDNGVLGNVGVGMCLVAERGSVKHI